MLNKNRRSFEKLFSDHIQCSCAAAEALKNFLNDPSAENPAFSVIVEQESLGDEITRQTHELLDRTYITDFDKSDVERLITKLDDILDGMKTVVKRVRNYNIVILPPLASEFADTIIGMVAILQNLIRGLSSLKSSSMQEAIRSIRSLEESADGFLNSSLEALFRDETIATKKFIALKEILERLEKITDYCQDVIDVISSIVRKEAR
ncbi:MAG: DUF47 family protein [Candidatus Niyogibacteria bacterium]|nr:DUF47 family protein [Candidatus Niyogibacteria bacterium]